MQKAYTDMDKVRFNPVSISGMQTRATDILHGIFSTDMRLEGDNGGSCASFFWYHVSATVTSIETLILTLTE